MKRKYKSIGKRIADRRRHLGLTQAELSERAKLNSKYISQIENTKDPKFGVDTILKLCRALDVTPNYLMIGLRDGSENAEYIEVEQKLKLCTTQQLRQVSMHIDAVLSE